MAELICTRVSTDEQSTQRQTDLLAETGLVNGAGGCGCSPDSATSCKFPVPNPCWLPQTREQRAAGDRLTVSELYRLCRDLADIPAVRDWCRAQGVKLCVLSGPCRTIVDLAATDATTTMLVDDVVSVGQFNATCQTNFRATAPESSGQPPAAIGRRGHDESAAEDGQRQPGQQATTWRVDSGHVIPLFIRISWPPF